MKALQKYVIPGVKIGIAVSLIWFLASKGFLDFEKFQQLELGQIIILLAFMFVIICLQNHRWRIVLSGRGFKNTFSDTMQLTLIGLFFNYAVPGSVGGDVVKGYYITKDHRDRRLDVATTVLVDRIVGFFTLFVMASLAVGYNFELLYSQTQTRPLALAIFLTTAGLLSGVTVALWKGQAFGKTIEPLVCKVPGGQKIMKIYYSLAIYRNHVGQLLGSFALCLFNQVTMITFMILVGVFLNETVPYSAYFFAAPIGFILMAVPISPGSVGVGQLAFMFLFGLFSEQKTDIGQIAITAFQACAMFWGLTGAYFYVRRRKPVLAAMAELKTQ